MELFEKEGINPKTGKPYRRRGTPQDAELAPEDNSGFNSNFEKEKANLSLIKIKDKVSNWEQKLGRNLTSVEKRAVTLTPQEWGKLNMGDEILYKDAIKELEKEFKSLGMWEELKSLYKQAKETNSLPYPVSENKKVDKKYILTESKLKSIITNTVNRLINESYENINDDYNSMEHYTHFAIDKKTNKIAFEWDYSDIDNEELRTFKKDYFGEDLMNQYDLPLQNFVIYTKQTMKRKGIDINSNNNYLK